MTLFNKLLAELFPQEGDYSDHPSDSGGKTKFGITQKIAKKYAYRGDMRSLPLDTARHIYRIEFWEKPNFNSVAEISETIAHKLFNAGVNISPGRASAYLQKGLNAFNKQQELYVDIVPDGLIGSVTLSALKKYLDHRSVNGEDVMVKTINCLQGEYYLFLSQKYERNEDFVFGWINQRIHI